MTYEENLQLATLVLEKIKKTVTTSNDIIPAIELPTLDVKRLEEYESRFGLRRMHEMLNYIDYLGYVRESLGNQALIKLKQDNKASPMSTLYTAITMMGVGESVEVSHLAALWLARMDCKAPIHIVTIKGKKPTGEVFGHMLVVIGDFPFSTHELVPAFKGLSDDCVFIDPLLGIVGQANKIHTIKDQMAYMRVFSLNNIISPRFASNFKEKAEEIYKNAEAVSIEWRKATPCYPKPFSKPREEETGKAQNQTDSSAARSAFGVFKSDPHSSLLNELASFVSDPATQAAFDSINNKHYAQAIRRMCTVNHEKSLSMLKIILKFKDKLSISLDEQAGDKQQSALHIAASRNNQTAYDLLIAAGARQDIKDSAGKTALDYKEPAEKPSMLI